MPTIGAKSTFYVPLPEEESSMPTESLYASIDEPGGYERVGERNPYAHLDRGGMTPRPAHYDTLMPAVPPRPRSASDEGGYEPIGPRQGGFNPHTHPAARLPQGVRADYEQVTPRALRLPASGSSQIYFELECPPPVAAKPCFLQAGQAVRERRGL